jgi:hypothetical protein
MLNISGVNSNIFSGSANSIKMTPVVIGEWNQNLFNPAYFTVAGDGDKLGIEVNTENTSSSSVEKLNFENSTLQATLNSGYVNIQFESISNLLQASAFKIITYVKTSSTTPITININAIANPNNSIEVQGYGSSSVKIDNLGWTKIETYVACPDSSVLLDNLQYDIVANSFNKSTEYNISSQEYLYFTEPEIYKTTYFDYQYGSLWPTDSVTTGFRPGESYITSSSTINYSEPDRTIYTEPVSGVSGYNMPISPVVSNPNFYPAFVETPVFKRVLPSDLMPYKYFLSNSGNEDKAISILYEKNIKCNKLVLKFNTIMTTPTINVLLDDSSIFQGEVNSDGYLILNHSSGSSWTTSRRTDFEFNTLTGNLDYTTFKKITIVQTSQTINSAFSNFDTQEDLTRMQLIEVSPRLEINLTNYVVDMSINKSLDNKNSHIPISSINSNDASISLSNIPISNISNAIEPVTLFSNQSNNSSSILANMLRKNIKFYLGYKLINSDYTNYANLNDGKYIPAGIFYSDTWQENDINTSSVQCYDITRYLQTNPVADYVSSLKTVFEVITNILDLSGFTDYDHDSLYNICNNASDNLDLAYYYCNSKDTTLLDALSQIFLAYQIGAYIDEYGIMKFKSLKSILSNPQSVMNIDETYIIKDGYSITTKAKPGKISLRYQSPKIKQSLALQNATDPTIKNSPSFVLTTSNDVVWSQQNIDAVGFNYLSESMESSSNSFNLNPSDTLDIFHTFNLNNNGFAIIENEIVSFVYKEYRIHNSVGDVTVSVKSDLELNSEINKFSKKYATKVKKRGETDNLDVIVEFTGRITNVERGLFGTRTSQHNVLQDTDNISVKNLNCDNGSASVVNNKINLTSSNTTDRVLLYGGDEDQNYSTYSVKFNFSANVICAMGLFTGNFQNFSNPLYIELSKFIGLHIYSETFNNLTALYTAHPTGEYGDIYAVGENQYYMWNGSEYILKDIAKYAITVYTDNGTSIFAYADVTNIVKNILNNLPKVLNKTSSATPTSGSVGHIAPEYQAIVDEAFNLKFVQYQSPGTSQGENEGTAIRIYLNNIEITNWAANTTLTHFENPTENLYEAIEFNSITLATKKLVIPTNFYNINNLGSYFGAFACSDIIVKNIPQYQIDSNGFETYLPDAQAGLIGNVREIYATKKPLKERGCTYYYQDREFLNAIVQKQNIPLPTYIMQTKPEVIGINYYDIQYTNPAATSTDIYPIEYLLSYYPSDAPEDKFFEQQMTINDHSLSYSSPLNTGFRARFAIANNLPNMVFINRDPDALIESAVRLNLWTHAIIAPSDPEIIEKNIDNANLSEVVQLDSEWIQSKEAAYDILNVIEKSIDGFSKDVSLQIFGNPLIQVGDIINLSYNLKEILNQKYLVHSISQSFNNGLNTSLTLNILSQGDNY